MASIMAASIKVVLDSNVLVVIMVSLFLWARCAHVDADVSTFVASGIHHAMRKVTAETVTPRRFTRPSQSRPKLKEAGRQALRQRRAAAPQKVAVPRVAVAAHLQRFERGPSFGADRLLQKAPFGQGAFEVFAHRKDETSLSGEQRRLCPHRQLELEAQQAEHAGDH